MWIGLSLLASLVPFFLRERYGVELPESLDFFISVALLLHIGNIFIEATNIGMVYNKITHLFSSCVLTFIIFMVLYSYNVQFNKILSNRHTTAIITISMVITLGVFWEFAEWISDLVINTGCQLGLDDTIGDLFMNTIGAIAISFYIVKWDVFYDMR